MSNTLSPEKKILAIHLLAEGSSIRSVERVTEVHRDTIMRLGVRVGEFCKGIMGARIHGLKCKNIEVDEIWGYIGKKQKLADRSERATGTGGDIWTFVSLDVDTKIIPNFMVGLRDKYHATAFIEDLARRLDNRTQITSDGLPAYVDAVERSFGSDVDFGQIQKTYSITNLITKEAARRYSPAEVVSVEKKVIIGNPNMDLISTSHVEKQNHTLRMHCRRLSRLTNAFSKKRDNFEAAVALSFAYYNFCRRHIAVRCTPAQAAGIEASQWTVRELLERCGEI